MDILLHTLKNGMRLAHVNTKEAVAHLGIIVNVGSRDEDAREHGLAHFTEHLFFKGTKKRKSFHIFSRIEDAGGEINAYTNKEETAIHTSFLKDDYERAMELLSDIILNSTFPEKELQKEKDVIIEEINSYLDSPAELIFDEFEEQIFSDSSIGRSILGKPETVKSFTRNDVCQFIAKNYIANEMALFSVGNISDSHIIKLFEKYFGYYSSADAKERKETNQIYNPSTITKQKDTFQNHCILGTRAYSITHEKRLGMYLLNNMLGGNCLNSRLNLALRERNGFAYTVESNYVPYSDTGIFLIYFATDKKYLDKCVSLIYKEIDKLCATKLGIMQLSRAKKQLKGYVARSFENRESMAIGMGKSLIMLNKIHGIDEICSEIDSITSSQLLEIANEAFAPSKMSMLIYNQK
jgi:predicted Zn-dependent peptidase